MDNGAGARGRGNPRLTGDADRPPHRGDCPGGHRSLDHLPPAEPERSGGAGEAEGAGGEDGEAGESLFFFEVEAEFFSFQKTIQSFFYRFPLPPPHP